MIPFFGGLTSTGLTRTLQAPLEEKVWIWKLDGNELHCDELRLSLIGWLEADHGWSRLDAYQLLTQAGQLYVGNMVDTTYSVVASIERRYLAGR